MTQAQEHLESLNSALENAWCRLAELRGGAKAWVYITPAGRVILRTERLPDPLGAEVGQFGAAVGLVEFRGRVFEAFEGMRRPS